MVREARRKSSQCLDAALLEVGYLAAMTGIPLNAVEWGAPAKAAARQVKAPGVHLN